MFELLKQAIEKFASRKVLVIGDIMLDQYTFGEVVRMSPEAPVPILKKQMDQYVLGGAANVASNLSALGAEVALCGFAGDDARKDKVFELLKQKNIRGEGIVVRKSQPTTLKQRLVSAGHQLLRLDDDGGKDVTLEEEKVLLEAVAKELKHASAVVLSDYDKGCFSPKLAREIIELCRKENKIIVADIKPQNKEWFKGVHVLTPNLKEGRDMTGLAEPAEIGRKLSEEFGADIILTLGGEGIQVFSKTGQIAHIPSKKVKVFDVSGAGDTVAAVAVLGLLGGLDLEQVGTLANHAGAIVVQKPGTAVVSPEELYDEIDSYRSEESRKI